jgi:hypothetical protein
MAPLALRRIPVRIAIYKLLQSYPGEAWTVSTLTARLPPSAHPSTETVRATLYVLAEYGILLARHEGPALQFVLAAGALGRLRSLLNERA